MTDSKAMPNPWDRQRDENGPEPMLWFGRFDDYRAQGAGRSVSRTHREWRESNGYEKQTYRGYPRSWSDAFHRWHWKERAEAWDEHRRQLDYIAEQAEHDEMRKRHADIGKALQGVGAKALQRFQQNQSIEVDPPNARLMLKDGIGIERTAKGLPAELLALYLMSDEELQKTHERNMAALRGPDSPSQGERDSDAGPGPDADAAD